MRLAAQADSESKGQQPQSEFPEVDDSGSSSDSSSKASSDGDGLVPAPGFAAEVHGASWHPDTGFAVRKSPKTVRRIPLGSTSDV